VPAQQAVQVEEAAEAKAAAAEPQAREAMSGLAAPRDPEAFPGRAVPLEAPEDRVLEELPGEAERPAREQQGYPGRVERRERAPEDQ